MSRYPDGCDFSRFEAMYGIFRGDDDSAPLPPQKISTGVVTRDLGLNIPFLQQNPPEGGKRGVK